MLVAGPIDLRYQGYPRSLFSNLQPASIGLHRRSLLPSLTGKMRPKEGEDLPEAIQQVNSRPGAPSPRHRLFFCSVEWPALCILLR